MGQALYRKYRPKGLADMVGQEHVTDTLAKAIKSGRISHAYLLSGPKGVGKTSVARILAHEVNDLEYHDESIHLDIIEIDAASNRRIDEIRDLRDKIHITPTSAKYKVYIIDEVHMLTREAFNALLKTLEEPPAHCIFILATTEPHKLPETIISRTQRFNFKSIEKSAATAHLAKIAKQEKLNISPEALELLAEHGEGSFRDSIGLLDRLSNQFSKITAEAVLDSLGIPQQAVIEKLLAAIGSGQSREVLELSEELKKQAISPSEVAKSLSKSLRTSLLSGQAAAWQTTLLRALLEVPASAHPQDNLEINLLEAAGANQTGEAAKAPVPQLESKVEPLAGQPVSPPETAPGPPARAKGDSPFKLEDWPKVVSEVKGRAASLYTALRLAIPQIDGDKLILSFQFPLHQKKIAQAGARDLVSKLIEEMSGTKLAIESVVDKSLERPNKTPAAKPSADDSQVQNISNIFGGAEVLES